MDCDSLRIGHLDLPSRAFKAVLETKNPREEEMKARVDRI